MKTAWLLFAFVFAFAPARADEAGGRSPAVELAWSIASEPADNFGGTPFGVEVDVLFDLARLSAGDGAGEPVTIRGIVGLAYHDWDWTFFGFEPSFTRTAVLVGGRAVWPTTVRLFGQLGLEVSFDEVETPGTFFSEGSTESDTRVGVTPSVGALFPLSGSVYLGLKGAYHVIEDGYGTLALTLGIGPT